MLHYLCICVYNLYGFSELLVVFISEAAKDPSLVSSHVLLGARVQLWAWSSH